jgi:hypothetical protein
MQTSAQISQSARALIATLSPGARPGGGVSVTVSSTSPS